MEKWGKCHCVPKILFGKPQETSHRGKLWLCSDVRSYGVERFVYPESGLLSLGAQHGKECKAHQKVGHHILCFAFLMPSLCSEISKC